MTKYIFGKELTKENYQNLRSLAQKISFKDFHEATGFGQGIYTRLRRFSLFEEYKKYVNDNLKKYYPRKEKRAITLKDIYEKLVDLEKLIENK